MADVAQISPSTSTEAPATPKKAAKKDKKIDRPKANNHPTTAIMVNSAVQNLKERGGSSLQAIKKYIATTYLIDAEKSSHFIRKYIRNAVAAGILIQTKGKGASGSFKLASTAVSKSTKPEKTAAKKSVTTVAAKKVPVKKSTKTKKSPARKAATREVKPKLPSKAKKTAKSPTRKPKSPKPKTTKAAKVAKSPKKTSLRRK